MALRNSATAVYNIWWSTYLQWKQQIHDINYKDTEVRTSYNSTSSWSSQNSRNGDAESLEMTSTTGMSLNLSCFYKGLLSIFKKFQCSPPKVMTFTSKLKEEKTSECSSCHSLLPFPPPPWCGLNKLMRNKLPLPPCQLLEVADPQFSNLCLLFSSDLPHNHCQPAFGSHHDPTPPFGMVWQPLQINPFSNKGFIYRRKRKLQQNILIERHVAIHFCPSTRIRAFTYQQWDDQGPIHDYVLHWHGLSGLPAVV